MPALVAPIAKTDVQWFNSRPAATEAEAAVVRTEKPIYDRSDCRGRHWAKASGRRPLDIWWPPVADRLVTQIESGQLSVGALLPNPEALAAEHGISVTSASSALLWLEKCRLVSRDRIVQPRRLPEQGRRAGLVNPRSTALLVIDVQKGFVNERSSGALPGIVRLIQGWNDARAPVVISQFHNPKGSPYEVITGWTRLRTQEEQELAGEVAELSSGTASFITKTQSSIFTPAFAALARASGWTDLVLCGIDTDACVYDSAISAYHAGYRPWIVTDACASSGGVQYHDAALLMAGRNIGRDQLVSSDEVLARIGAHI